MENVLVFLRAAAPWVSLGLLVAFFCVRPTVRKGNKENDGGDYAVEGMCFGMCIGLAIGSSVGDGNSGLGTSLGMLIGLAIGLCTHKSGEESEIRNNVYPSPLDKQTVYPSALEDAE